MGPRFRGDDGEVVVRLKPGNDCGSPANSHGPSHIALCRFPCL